MKTFFVRGLIVGLACCLAAGCALYQKRSYVALTDSNHSALAAGSEEPEYKVVDDMDGESQAMYDRGYVMLGYSQFISPQSPLFAKVNSLNWGREVGASAVLEQKPEMYDDVVDPGRLTNFAYLITFWAKRKVSGPGFVIQDLPPDVLETMGEENNLVMVNTVVDETPAYAAGLRASDVLLAFNGERIMSTKGLLESLSKNAGQPVNLTLWRAGEKKDVQLELDENTTTPLLQTEHQGSGNEAPSTVGDLAFHDRPWLKTRARDWSALAGAIQGLQDLGRQIQEQERIKRELAKERADALYQEQLAAYDSMKRERELRHSPKSSVQSSMQSQQEFQSTMKKWYQVYQRDSLNRRNQAMDIWLNNAPRIYNQVFKYPRPRAF